MRRTKLATLAENDFEGFRKELLRYHTITSVKDWEDDRGCLREYRFHVKDKEYRFTMLNGEVLCTYWGLV